MFKPIPQAVIDAQIAGNVNKHTNKGVAQWGRKLEQTATDVGIILASLSLPDFTRQCPALLPSAHDLSLLHI